MQRLLLLLGTAALTLATTACSNDKDDNGGNGGGITPTEGVTTEAFYKGDLYGAGTGNLWINFISDMEYNASAGDYTGPGYILCLDFNTTLAANTDFAALAEGTYTCDYTKTRTRPSRSTSPTGTATWRATTPTAARRASTSPAAR